MSDNKKNDKNKSKDGRSSDKKRHGMLIIDQMIEENVEGAEEVKQYLGDIDKSRRKMRWWLIAAIACLILLLVVIHHYTVMRYAVLSRLEVTQNRNEPGQIDFFRATKTGGMISYYYGSTELTEYLAPGTSAPFHWDWNTSEDRINIVVRSRWFIFPRWYKYSFDKQGIRHTDINFEKKSKASFQPI